MNLWNIIKQIKIHKTEILEGDKRKKQIYISKWLKS